MEFPHLFGRRLAPEGYPLFSQRAVAEVRFGVACESGRSGKLRVCETEAHRLRLSAPYYSSRQDY
jgi:hypothetical protein